MVKFGFCIVNEMIGCVEVFKVCEDLCINKIVNIDFFFIFMFVYKFCFGVVIFNVCKQDYCFYVCFDNKFIFEVELIFDKGFFFCIECDIVNIDCVMGILFFYYVFKRFGEVGFFMDIIYVNIKGLVGQFFGVFFVFGIILEFEGDVNDYVGKGLFGGCLIVYFFCLVVFKVEENIFIGNVCLYGVISGIVFFCGVVVECFVVCNFGVIVVVEGVGDYGCEYMIGGCIVIFGSIGCNFVVGMFGGIVYVFDIYQDFFIKFNIEMVEVGFVEDFEEVVYFCGFIEDYYYYIGFEFVVCILVDFNCVFFCFIKVLFVDYKCVFVEEVVKVVEVKCVEYNFFIIFGVEQKKEVKKEVKKEYIEKFVDIEESFGDQICDKKKVFVFDKIKGFMKYQCCFEKYCSVKMCVKDWVEFFQRFDEDEFKYQFVCCMDCGVFFCQFDIGCFIFNIIFKWNEFVFQNQWQDVFNCFFMINNFFEFIGCVCFVFCEGVCVFGINEDFVGIKFIECVIIDRGFEKGWMVFNFFEVCIGKKVVIIGFGFVGFVVVDQLNKVGYFVIVYECVDCFGGLFMYGIFNMKFDKCIVDRCIKFMVDEGVIFKIGVFIGDDIKLMDFKVENDVVIIVIGVIVVCDFFIKGCNFEGIYFVMEFFYKNIKFLFDFELVDGFYIFVKDKYVVVIGGGDIGNDCIGIFVCYGVKLVVNFELLFQFFLECVCDNLWFQWFCIYCVDYGYIEVV